jgi:hypothetical protein
MYMRARFLLAFCCVKWDACRDASVAFGAMTQQLQELAEWLRQFGVTQVAGIQRRLRETGLEILEGQFTVVLANAEHIKNAPGRKTDHKDAEMDCAVAAVWSSAGQLHTLRNHSRSTRPDQNAGQSVPRKLRASVA